MVERVRCELLDGVARVILDRPAQRNGMDLAMLQQMLRLQRQLRRQRGLRAVVIAGAGPSFCAGLDFASVLAKRRHLWQLALNLWSPWRNALQTWSLGWRALPVPVIAALHGHCLGAGLQLALGADIRIARADAELSFMEARWGLIPDMGGLALVRELVRPDQAIELVMSGRIVSGQAAAELGLVTTLADDPVAAALALAQRLSVGSPDAIAAAKRALLGGWHHSNRAILRAERRAQRQLFGSPNQRLAMRRGRDPQGVPEWGPRRID